MTRRHVSAANPRSTNPADPYVNADLEGLPRFRVTDPTSHVFAHPETFEIVEVTRAGTGIIRGFGYRVLRNGSLSTKISGDAIVIDPRDIPDRIAERLLP